MSGCMACDAGLPRFYYVRVQMPDGEIKRMKLSEEDYKKLDPAKKGTILATEYTVIRHHPYVDF